MKTIVSLSLPKSLVAAVDASRGEDSRSAAVRRILSASFAQDTKK
jgi:metal-responsive CopG/Arc/MetJ family transcriptional regulator